MLNLYPIFVVAHRPVGNLKTNVSMHEGLDALCRYIFNWHKSLSNTLRLLVSRSSRHASCNHVHVKSTHVMTLIRRHDA